MVVNYRQGYNLFACNGLLFNHESPRRGETFVTRKVTQAVARILAGQQHKLYLGNLEAQRDWGTRLNTLRPCGPCCSKTPRMTTSLALGRPTRLDFVEAAFAYAGLDWRAYVEIDPRYFRPTDVACLQADATKARGQLGWEPKVTFEELIAIMVDADMEALGLQPIGAGQHTLATKFAGGTSGLQP